MSGGFFDDVLARQLCSSVEGAKSGRVQDVDVVGHRMHVVRGMHPQYSDSRNKTYDDYFPAHSQGINVSGLLSYLTFSEGCCKFHLVWDLTHTGLVTIRGLRYNILIRCYVNY